MTNRGAIIILGLFVGLIIIGLVTEEDPLPSTNWVDDPSIIRGFKKDPGRYQGPDFQSVGDYPPKDRESLEWTDFLETLEKRGLDYQDPSAVEIWELEFER